MKRIGIYGGSFDPIHWGHLLAAQAAYEELSLDRLFFVPASRSPFKPERRPLAAEQRLRLIRLALAGSDGFEVCESELQVTGVSFTINTVRRFAGEHPDAELICLVGADHVGTLPEWKDAEVLSQMASFAVIPRPGLPGRRPPDSFDCRWLRGWPIELSSSEIRERIRHGKSIRRMVDPAVADAILSDGLYQDG